MAQMPKRKVSKKPPTWNEIQRKLAAEGKESTRDFWLRTGKKLKERKMNNEIQRKPSTTGIDEIKKKRERDDQ